MPPKKIKGEEEYQGEEAEIDSKPKARSDFVKCLQCKTRWSRRGCAQSRCLQCCGDEQCEAHAEARDRAKYQDELLRGTTDISRRAKRQRALELLPGAFREPGFSFMEQSIKIWDIREFMANPKWKEDAVRKAQKRKARSQQPDKPPLRLKNSRKRFRAMMDERYKKSLENT